MTLVVLGAGKFAGELLLFDGGVAIMVEGGAEVVLSGPQREEAMGHKKRTRRGYSMRDGLREGRNLSAEEGGE